MCFHGSQSHFLAIHEFLSFFFIGTTTALLIYLSLTLHFEQANFDMRESLRRNSIKGYQFALKSHIEMERETKKINEEYKIMYFYTILLFKFTFCPLVYSSDAPDTIPVIKFSIKTFVGLILFSLFELFNAVNNLKNSAHRPLRALHHYMAQNENMGNGFRTRMKLMRFIERLSGPEIGFYCLNLFPLNSYHFVAQVADSVSYYLLIITHLKNSGFK